MLLVGILAQLIPSVSVVSATATSAAFDRLASRYDEICDSAIFSWMRRQVHEQLARRLRAGSAVLEIGCGTGIDAAFLARKGAGVVACDPAPGMLSRTRERIVSEGLESHVVLASCGAAEIDRWLARTPGVTQRFDGIFSDFGALNCLNDLSSLGELASRRLRPGGWIMLCLLNQFCWIEMAGHLLTGHPRTAFRRYSRGRRQVTVEVEGIPVLTRYHRRSDVVRALGPGWVVTGLRGLGVMVPPPYFAHRWQQLSPRTRRAIERIDTFLADRRPFAYLGDHFLIELVKR